MIGFGVFAVVDEREFEVEGGGGGKVLRLAVQPVFVALNKVKNHFFHILNSHLYIQYIDINRLTCRND